MTATFNTATIEETEPLAMTVTKNHYVRGWIDHDEFERRVESIIGLRGKEERERVLATSETVDVTCFGGSDQMLIAAGWDWPDA